MCFMYCEISVLFCFCFFYVVNELGLFMYVISRAVPCTLLYIVWWNISLSKIYKM